MVWRTSPLRIPFPRRFIIRIHLDLFRIERYALPSVQYSEPLLLVEKMVLVAEDRRFFRHNGIDCVSCFRELLKFITFRRYGGASTIDMQFVRMATGYYERSIQRKFYEMLLALLVQFKYSKIDILRSYLNSAFFGSHLYGLSKASQSMFQKHPWELTHSEASTIAAMLVYPRPRQPTPKWLARIERRSRYVAACFPLFEKRFEKLPRWEAV
jgi:membrane peptidoglycan carboxypeptidase